jgi:hypothetical protein
MSQISQKKNDELASAAAAYREFYFIVRLWYN